MPTYLVKYDPAHGHIDRNPGRVRSAQDLGAVSHSRGLH